MEQYFSKITALIILLLVTLSCKSNLDQQFSLENDQLIEEWKSENKKFIQQNSEKLTDSQMLKSLDSIVIEYTINKNKKLAIKFIKTEKGVKRLNFLKKSFSKEEIKSLLKKVPESIKTDTNYIALQKYISPE
ncbi:MAG: hypothetical protein REI96_00305 [Flavobacterium nitrogenifigens]|uniref:hypothetical protein n=1 Tax=Flavobacterium nitrogenifigens TaxID=1617283 RepID=UPI002809374E|nr:hypothetical protein [Flavobacterium nitrogenifigens]MDQ8010858.1 hypothetical protein [Flavobacterium nitrogenifigens]